MAGTRTCTTHRAHEKRHREHTGGTSEGLPLAHGRPLTFKASGLEQMWPCVGEEQVILSGDGTQEASALRVQGSAVSLERNDQDVQWLDEVSVGWPRW